MLYPLFLISLHLFIFKAFCEFFELNFARTRGQQLVKTDIPLKYTFIKYILGELQNLYKTEDLPPLHFVSPRNNSSTCHVDELIILKTLMFHLSCRVSRRVFLFQIFAFVVFFLTFTYSKRQLYMSTFSI